jgi:cell wall-associated NlpC family hydrolase
MTDKLPLRRGDVICTRSDGRAGRVIRFGAALLGKPNTVNHVALYMGKGSDKRPRVIEGRPGGVGWRDASDYLKSEWTIDNREQPKTPEQRQAITEAAKAMLGTPYDWKGIGLDAMIAIRAPIIYDDAEKKNQPSPDQIVCSSLADWVYAQVGLANPNRLSWDRITTPGDWAEFITVKGWEKTRTK